MHTPWHCPHSGYNWNEQTKQKQKKSLQKFVDWLNLVEVSKICWTIVGRVYTNNKCDEIPSTLYPINQIPMHTQIQAHKLTYNTTLLALAVTQEQAHPSIYLIHTHNTHTHSFTDYSSTVPHSVHFISNILGNELKMAHTAYDTRHWCSTHSIPYVYNRMY